MGSSKVSALVVLVPEAEGLVKPFRDRHDPSAAEGMPAHITLLYPFKSPEELGAGLVATLQDLITRFWTFTFSLAHVRRFPDVLYLAPTPDEPFKELTRLIAQHFPETPPYAGAFVEIIPHLTVAQVADPERLADIALEFGRVAHERLPVQANATEVVLMDNARGLWQVRAKLRLGKA